MFRSSFSFALAGLTVFLTSSPVDAQRSYTPGAQCHPAANEAMYRNCRIRIVNGTEVCRCSVAPNAQTRRGPAQQSGDDNPTTGSVGTMGAGIAGAPQGSFGRVNSGISSSSGAAVSAIGAFSGANPPASGAGSPSPASGNTAVGGNAPASGSAAKEQDNAGIGNGWEGSDVRDRGGAAAVAASGIDTSRGDPDNPAHGSGASPGNSSNAGKSAEAPGRNK
jgi:hypothetical protein